MSGPAADDFFAAPPFDPAAALVQLQRTLRSVRGLVERGAGFECNGHAVVSLAVDGATLQARLARRPATRPEWETRALRNGADVRRFGDDVKRRAERWKDGDD